MIACIQCFGTLAQVLAVCSACAAPVILNLSKIFRKKLKKPLDIDDNYTIID